MEISQEKCYVDIGKYKGLTMNYNIYLFLFKGIKQLERGDYEDLYYVNLKEFLQHMLNISQVLASIHVDDYFDCAIECLANVACFSFNFAISDNNSGSHVCHLLAADKYSYSSSFVRSDDFHHYAVPVRYPQFFIFLINNMTKIKFGHFKALMSVIKDL